MPDHKFLENYLEKLRNEVCKKSDIIQIIPSDCKKISVDVFRSTQKSISETTLKRFFGFANTLFQPSLFTLNALAEYAGYKGWKDFNDHNKGNTEVSDWDKTAAYCDKITSFTLQVLKNKSGINYEQTIPRKFFNDHINYFTESDKKATLVLAPAGYGKTIALCHWLDNKIAENKITENKDIFLFFSGSALSNVSNQHRDISDWLLSMLGLTSEEQLLDLKKLKDGQEEKFFLIIDGFGNELNDNEFARVFEQFLDVLNVYERFSWFKTIITLRPAKWKNNRHKLLKTENWFFGFVPPDVEVNFPLFDFNEIYKLSETVKMRTIKSATPNMVGNFSYPLYLQYHFQETSKKEKEQLDELGMYDIVSSYILNNIYRATYSGEMLLLIVELMSKMNLKNGVYFVNKLQLMASIDLYKAAYEELLNIDFFEEVNQSTKFEYLVKVQLTNERFLAFSIAKKLLLQNMDSFDEALILTINHTIHEDLKPEIVKWCIYLTVSNKRLCSVDLLSQIPFSIKQKGDILTFLGKLLKNQLLNESSDLLIASHLTHNKAFDFFFGLEFINADYEDTLETILRFPLTPREKILLYTSIGIVALIQLDLDKLNEQIGILYQFNDEDFEEFPINPRNCMETIYYHLRFGITKKESLKQITEFYFEPPKSIYSSTGFNDVLFLLALYTLSFCKNPRKSLRFINSLEKIYPNHSKGYYVLFNILKAETLNLLKKEKAAAIVYRELSAYFETDENYTDFMKISYEALKVKLMVNEPESLKDFTFFMDKCNRLAYNFTKINSLAYMVARKKSLRKDEEIFQDINEELSKMIIASGCKVDSLIY